MIESGPVQLVQSILLIDVPESLQLSRASQRDGQSSQQIEQIMAAQLPRLTRQQQADDIVLNDGSLSHLYEQLKPLHQQYLMTAKQFN